MRATGAPIGGPLHHAGPVNSARSSPDGARVRPLPSTKPLVYGMRRPEVSRSANFPLQHDGQVTSAAFSPDGKRVVTASDDQTARPIPDRAMIGKPMQHDNLVRSARPPAPMARG